MGWLRFWIDWLKGEQWPAWEPTPQNMAKVIALKAPQEPAEWSDEQAVPDGNVRAATPSISDPSRSDEGSDGKNANGDATSAITLDHDGSLPRHTWRVFPVPSSGRNTYDSPASVERAVQARKSRPYHYNAPGGATEPIRVYRAETWWIDVTEEFVKE